MSSGKGPEARLTDGEIIFFMQRQEYKGYINMYREHCHSFYELYYVEQGSRWLFQNGMQYKLTPKQLALLPPGQMHMTKSFDAEIQEHIFCGFSCDFFDDFIPGKSTEELLKRSWNILRLKDADAFPISPLFKIIEELSEDHNDPVKLMRLKSVIFDMLFNFSLWTEDEDENIYTDEMNLNPRIKYIRIANYIKKNYREKITLEILSDEFSMSKYEISRNFQKYFGCSLPQYLNTFRIQEAKSLLTNSENNMLSISETVGFDSVSSFGRVFKKMVSLTPSEYIKKYKRK